MIKKTVVRGVRKSAYLSRRVLSVGANYSGRVENKAHRIINGTDSSIVLKEKVQFEKLYYESIPHITPIHPALPKAGRKAHVTLFIPSLQKSSFFGGTATALIFAAMVAEKKNMPLVIVETLKHGKLKERDLLEFYETNKITLSIGVDIRDISSRRYNHYGYIDLHPDDLFICSAWWDAYLIDRLPLKHKFIYLIQDFEPIFYNNSDMYNLAESTYASERFVPVCNTALMLKFMKSRGYKYIADNGISFEPAVNVGSMLGVTMPSKEKVKKKLFLYGRPSVERNLFYSATDALNQIFTENSLDPSGWECYMAGQDGLSTILLESGQEITNLGKMTTAEYYEFAKDVDLAVSLMMAPHPSYPPLELASLGAAVVTTRYETKQDLSKYSNNIFMTDLNVESIKEGILLASKLPAEERYTNAQSTKLPSSWEESLATTVDNALTKI